MANVKNLSGVAVDALGVVLASKTATLKNNAGGATVDSTTTDANGKWSFAGIDETVRHRVEIAVGGASAQVTRRSPAGVDLDDAYIYASLRTAAAATVVFGGAISVVTGGLTVSAGGITVTGNSTITGTLGGLTGLTVASGGATVTAGNLDVTAGLVRVGQTANLPAQAAEAVVISGNATGGGQRLSIVVANNTDAGMGQLAFLRSRGTMASRAIVAADDILSAVDSWGFDGTNPILSARIVSFVDGTPGTTDMPSRMAFYTTPDASATATERMRINAAGQVLVGTGTNAAPSLAHLTDGNSGVRFGGDDTVRIVTNGGEKITCGASTLGFFGSTATQQNVSGAKGGNAALASLISALVTCGLITDSSTA